ncbi:MAG: hypothetical protein OXG44_09150 [Gammaproteobacteria bacterium]|nr:hypothetical protein [Gammaproteobacteria bacterium]
MGAKARKTVVRERLNQTGFTAGALWVMFLSVAIVVGTTFVTWCFWEDFVGGESKDSPTNVLRNMGFLAAGVVTWVFALWRGVIAKQQEVIADQQAETARSEHLHGRFETAQQLFAREGVGNSHARISGLHTFRYLVRDEPGEFAAEVLETVMTFLVQADVNEEERDLKEFAAALETASMVLELVDSNELYDAESRRRLRFDLASAVKQLETRLRGAGIDPGFLFRFASLRGVDA